MAKARLILLSWDSDRADYERIANLLWTNSTLALPATVLVIVDDYHADQAMTLFRMGVDEYVCRSDHSEKLKGVLGQWLTGRESAAKIRAKWSPRRRPVQDPLPRSPQWERTETVASSSL